MLSKEACMYCCNEFCSIREYNMWTDTDERRWDEKEVVCCPFEYSKKPGIISIHDKPPVWCPYKLEHIVGIKNVE